MTRGDAAGPTAETLFAGPGESMAALRATDWSATALGPVDSWRPELVAAIRTVLHSRLPTLLWWGPDLVQLYNDPCLPNLGDKHPGAAGQPAAQCWHEVWDALRPVVRSIMDGRQDGVRFDEQLMFFTRRNYVEETYQTYSLSGVRDESGAVLGIFVQNTDGVTAQVLDDRRLRTLRELGSVPIAAGGTATDACRKILKVLAGNRADVPFGSIYLIDGSGEPQLVDHFGFRPGALLPPREGTNPVALHPVAADGGERRAVADHRHAGTVPRLLRPDRRAGRCRTGLVADAATGRTRPVRAARRAGPRDQPAPKIRCGLPRLLPPGRRSCLDRGHRCSRLRGRAGQGSGAGRDRRREDQVLPEHQPRAPDPADPGAGSAAAGARRSGAGAAGRVPARPAGRPPGGATPATAGRRPARRHPGGGRSAGPGRRTDRHRRTHRRLREHVPLGRRVGRLDPVGGAAGAGDVGAAGSADVVAHRAQSALQRREVHPARRHHGPGRTVRRPRPADRAGLRHRNPGAGDPVDLRPVPPGRRSARADRRGRGHRPLAGRRPGAGARRHDQGGQRPGHRLHLRRHRPGELHAHRPPPRAAGGHRRDVPGRRRPVVGAVVRRGGRRTASGRRIRTIGPAGAAAGGRGQRRHARVPDPVAPSGRLVGTRRVRRWMPRCPIPAPRTWCSPT